MSDETFEKDLRILRMMKKVLTDIAKDTHVQPGLKHPLSDNTIIGIRDCLQLITSREAEILQEQGMESNMRPRFVDEPPKSVVVQLDPGKSKNND
jgi:hypothetical protein